jgi:hypothetical protein
MEILSDQRWSLHSAAEARYVGRAAALMLDDGTETYLLKHQGTERPTQSESEFFDRELRYGELVISRTIAHKAELGFQRVQEADVATNGITQAIAGVFMDKIQAQRLADARQQVAEIQVTDNRNRQVIASVDGEGARPNPRGVNPLAA